VCVKIVEFIEHTVILVTHLIEIINIRSRDHCVLIIIYNICRDYVSLLPPEQLVSMVTKLLNRCLFMSYETDVKKHW